jgi:hypothetical protein
MAAGIIPTRSREEQLISLHKIIQDAYEELEENISDGTIRNERTARYFINNLLQRTVFSSHGVISINDNDNDNDTKLKITDDLVQTKIDKFVEDAVQLIQKKIEEFRKDNINFLNNRILIVWEKVLQKLESNELNDMERIAHFIVEKVDKKVFSFRNHFNPSLQKPFLQLAEKGQEEDLNSGIVSIHNEYQHNINILINEARKLLPLNRINNGLNIRDITKEIIYDKLLKPIERATEGAGVVESNERAAAGAAAGAGVVESNEREAVGAGVIEPRDATNDARFQKNSRASVSKAIEYFKNSKNKYEYVKILSGRYGRYFHNPYENEPHNFEEYEYINQNGKGKNKKKSKKSKKKTQKQKRKTQKPKRKTQKPKRKTQKPKRKTQKPKRKTQKPKTRKRKNN